MKPIKRTLSLWKNIDQKVCINMTMPRPSGKAQKIAEQTIPGLNSNTRIPKSRKRSVPNDEVEMKMTRINENRGSYEKKKSGI